jgi:CBS domain-containing protein
MGVISVKMDDDLETAQALMMRYDYSQLPVMSGPRNLRGAVSWESIAQARINKTDANLRDCTVDTAYHRFGLRFVQGADGKITGIVTTADLSNQFANLARPFFILGEIKRRIRRIVDDRFSVDDLKSCANPGDPTREIGSARDMTMGEYVRLLENPTCWSRLDWGLNRRVFIEALKRIQKARNEVMHFSPDPLDDEDLLNLENFVKWIKKLDFGP